MRFSVPKAWASKGVEPYLDDIPTIESGLYP